MARASLTKEDWLMAGFRALAHDGPAALRAERLARVLKTTKGSFYWHFSDLPSFKTEILQVWRSKVATDIMEDVGAATSPAGRLSRLLQRASEPPPEAYGGRAIEPAFRAWALSDEQVARALAELDSDRIDFIQSLLADMGADDPALATLIYASYIGLDDLASKGRADIGVGLARLLGLVGRDLP